MENASKAILIAGAVLVVIFVATVVIIFFNKGADSAEQIGKNITEAQIQAHNSQFNIYEGTGRTKAEIDKLVAVVNNNNSRKGAFIVSISGTGINLSGGKYEFTGSNFNSGNIVYYTVKITYNGKGLIDTITIN